MEDIPSTRHKASDYDIRDIECKAVTHYKEYSRVTVSFGVAIKSSSKFVLPKQALIQYKILYKTNADCNNDWHEIFGDNQPLKADRSHGYFDGLKYVNEPSSHVAFEITIPPGQLATFRILARVFQPVEATSSPFTSSLPVELLDGIFSYMTFDELREHASSVCKAWRNVIFAHSVALPSVVYVDPKETVYRAADGTTTCWCIKINNTASAIPKDFDPATGRFLQWQSSELRTEDHIYTTFLKSTSDVAAAIRQIGATYRLYANNYLLKQVHATFVPLDVRGKLLECGVPSATTFLFCKPIAPNSIVVSVITVKKRHIQPVEVIPTAKFATLFTLLNQLWPSIKPHEMKFKLRHNGKRLDITHADQTFTQLGITNFTWLRLDISHPDVIPINVYQIDDKVTTITVKSTMTRKAFREKVCHVTGADPTKSYIVNLDGKDDEPIGTTYSKERQLFDENICFLYENDKAKNYFEFIPMGQSIGWRQVAFDLDSTTNTFKKYLIARGECNLRNRLKKRGRGVLDMTKTLRQNGIERAEDQIEILH